MIKKYPKDAELYNIRGINYATLGMWKLAEKSFSRSLKLSPDNFDLLRNIANVQLKRSNFSMAENNLAKALRLNPRFAGGWNSLGTLYQDRGNGEKASAAFRKATYFDPDLTEAVINFLIDMERSNNLGQLNEDLKILRKTTTDMNVLTLFEGILFYRDNNYEQAYVSLNSVNFSGNIKYQKSDLELLRLQILAKTCDSLKKFDNAFAHFSMMNEIKVKRVPPVEFTPDKFSNIISSRFEYFSNFDKSDWNTVPTSNQEPVFVVGFPRSGTTLLDTFLRGHKDISVIEDITLVSKLTQTLGTEEGSIGNLSALSKNIALKSADNYLKLCEKYSENKPVIIDRLPFNLAYIGEIVRVFPKVKFILAIRDPADVVLSCFMQVFDLRGNLSSLSTLESTAKTYDQLMNLWLLYTEKLNVDHLVCRYEDLVENPTNSTKTIVEFLGLEWDASILDHQKTASDRDRIKTSSYAQVVQPIYKTAIKRWENYSEFIPEALEIVKPWRKHFGYDDS